MGLISLPSWSSRTNLLRIPGKESLGLIDHGFHSRLSQPSHRALDVELSGVSMDIDPAEVSTMKGPVKSRYVLTGIMRTTGFIEQTKVNVTPFRWFVVYIH